jgi:MOSC domain-containing protein YiiM
LEALSLEPGDVRKNITFRDLPTETLHPDAILDIGDGQLEIMGDCAPCARMKDIRPILQE